MDKTFVAGFLCVVLIVSAIVIGVSYTNTQKYQAMAEMVNKGANPQAVSCALEGVHSMNQQVCTSLANKGN